MSKHLASDRDFRNIIFSEADSKIQEYENCTFSSSIFSNSDLSSKIFSECTFISCEFSMAKITNTTFRDVIFKDCKLLGLHFDECNEFLLSFIFDNCILNFSSFHKLKLKKQSFNNCTLQEVDFSQANLVEAQFNNCDLNGAIFETTILEKTDFRTSYNYSIDPEINKIKKAKFSISESIGLLSKYDIIIE